MRSRTDPPAQQDHEPVPGLAESVLIAVHEVIVESIINRPPCAWGGQGNGFGGSYSSSMSASRSTSLLVIFFDRESRAQSRSFWTIPS